MRHPLLARSLATRLIVTSADGPCSLRFLRRDQSQRDPYGWSMAVLSAMAKMAERH